MSKNPTAFPYITAAGTTGFGMSLRDYFAAKVIPVVYERAFMEMEKTGFVANWKYGIALDAYAMADAMLEARSDH